MGATERRVDPEFEALFVAEFERCERVARRIVLDAGRAEELASEAFVRAWARWWRVRGGNPGAWVMKVTVNLAIDAARRGVAVPEGLTALSIEDLVATHVTLAEALRTLSSRQRTVVTMRYLADLSEAEVAERLGVSTGTVKTHLHRGLAGLRSQLDTPKEQPRHA